MVKASNGPRDRGMLAVGFEAGLRASELLGLNLETFRLTRELGCQSLARQASAWLGSSQAWRCYLATSKHIH